MAYGKLSLKIRTQGWHEAGTLASGWWLIYTNPNIMRNGWSCPKIPEKMLLEACQLFWFVEKKSKQVFGLFTGFLFMRKHWQRIHVAFLVKKTKRGLPFLCASFYNFNNIQAIDLAYLDNHWITTLIDQQQYWLVEYYNLLALQLNHK